MKIICIENLLSLYNNEGLPINLTKVMLPGTIASFSTSTGIRIFSTYFLEGSARGTLIGCDR